MWGTETPEKGTQKINACLTFFWASKTVDTVLTFVRTFVLTLLTLS